MRRLLTCNTCLLLNPNPSPFLHCKSLPCGSGNLRSRQRVHREPKGFLLSPEASCVSTLPAASSLQSRRESRFMGRKETYRIFMLQILMALVLAGALGYSLLALQVLRFLQLRKATHIEQEENILPSPLFIKGMFISASSSYPRVNLNNFFLLLCP